MAARTILLIWGIWLCASIVALPAGAATLDLPASHDNTIFGEDVLSNGAGEHLFAGTTNNGQLRRALLQFNVAGLLPAGAVINSATLTLHMSQTRAGPIDMTVHTVAKPWGESTSDATGDEGMGAPAELGDATWFYSIYDTAAWENPGGDFNTDEVAVKTVDASGFYNWSSALLTADVQTWLDDPASNFGWMLRGDEGTARTAKRFDSRESTIAGTQPVLHVDFTVPEPAGVMSAVALLAGLVKRNRRANRQASK